LKLGDRFYYETGDAKLKFTKDQLESIRHVSMARVLCKNVGIDFLQTRAFFVANRDWNQFAECAELPSLDISLWQEQTCSDELNIQLIIAAPVEHVVTLQAGSTGNAGGAGTLTADTSGGAGAAALSNEGVTNNQSGRNQQSSKSNSRNTQGRQGNGPRAANSNGRLQQGRPNTGPVAAPSNSGLTQSNRQPVRAPTSNILGQTVGGRSRARRGISRRSFF
jgi:hypothetical protein